MINKNKVAVAVLVFGLLLAAYSNINVVSAGSVVSEKMDSKEISISTPVYSSSKPSSADPAEPVNPKGGEITPVVIQSSVTTAQVIDPSSVRGNPVSAGYVTPGTFNSATGKGGDYGFPGNIFLVSTVEDSSSGAIYKGNIPFIHTFFPPGAIGQNTFMGEYAGNFDMISDGFSFNASNNTGVGYKALNLNTTGHDNVATGAYSLYSNSSGHSNAATGAYSLYSNINGSFNSASGYKSLYSNTLGIDNTAAGYNSLYSNTTGNYNLGAGEHSLYSNTTGDYNTAVGPESMWSNTTGASNAALGILSLHRNTTGGNNTAIGSRSLYSNTTGNYNTAVGPNSGYNTGVALQTMTNSTFVGSGANSSANGITNSTAIGAGAQVTKSNQVVIGNSAVTETVLRGNVIVGNKICVWNGASYTSISFAPNSIVPVYATSTSC